MARHSAGSASPPGRRRPWLWLTGLAALAGAGLFWLVLADRPAVVAVETLTAGPVTRVLAVNGQIAAEDSVQLRAQVSGTAREILVDEGDVVIRGQVLARLDDDQERALLRQAQSALDQGLVRQAQAAASYGRIRNLGDNVARSKLEDAERDLQSAVRDVERLRALVDQAAIQLDRTTITAPIAGTVMTRALDPGQLADTATPIFTIADLTRLLVETDVDEAYATTIQPGQPATLQLVGQQGTLAGTVTFVSPKVDPATGGLAVKIGFLAPVSAPVGLTVTANIVVDARDAALTVPRSALTDHSVLVERDGTVLRVTVEVIDWPAERLIVTAGLAAGDRVILTPAGLDDGQAVKVAK